MFITRLYGKKIQSLPYDFKSMKSCFLRENYVLIDSYLYYSMRLDQPGWFGDLMIQFWLKILDFDSILPKKPRNMVDVIAGKDSFRVKIVCLKMS